MTASIGDAGEGGRKAQTRIGGEDFKHARTRGGYRRCGLCENPEGKIRLEREVRKNALEVVARMHIKELRKRRKLALSLISLVKMSETLHFPLAWETKMVLSATHSRVEFSLFSMLPLVVIL